MVLEDSRTRDASRGIRFIQTALRVTCHAIVSRRLFVVEYVGLFVVFLSSVLRERRHVEFVYPDSLARDAPFDCFLQEWLFLVTLHLLELCKTVF